MKKFLSVSFVVFFFLFQCVLTPLSFGMMLSHAQDDALPDTLAPTIPDGLAAASKTETSVELVWKTSTDNVAVLEYEVFRGATKVGTTNTLTFTDQNLLPGTLYTYTVKAKDATGNISNASKPVEETTNGTAAQGAANTSNTSTPSAISAPTNVVLIDKTDTIINIQWDSPTDKNSISEYEIYNNATILGHSSTTSFSALGLTADTEYNISVKAKDQEGNLSAASNILTVKTLLPCPANINVNPKSNKIAVTWSAVNGAGSYCISVDGVIKDIGTNTAYTHEGLNFETQHVYKICAKRIDGEAGIWSKDETAVTTKLAAPEIGKTQQTFFTVNIEWNSISDADEYEVEADGVIVSNLTGTSYKQEGLPVNTVHKYRVRARNSGGYSEWSDVKAVTTTSFGTGTIDDPYIINSVEKLLKVKDNPTASYKLDCDIDLEGVAWEPVGSSTAPFTGTFDGNGYTVSNFTVNKPAVDNVGFFGYIKNGTIKNFSINNFSISGRQNTGGLAGNTEGTVLIQNCSAKGSGTVNGTYNVGGLIGSASGTVEKCSSSLDVTLTGSGYNCGGLIGQGTANVIKCYAIGTVVSSGNNVGGLIGYTIGNNINVTECYATGNTSGASYVGGLMGQFGGIGTNISNCFSLGGVTGALNSCVGGMIGNFKTGNAINCYSAGKINVNGNSVGGLFGILSGTVTNSFYDGVASNCIPQKVTDIAKLTSAMKAQVSFNDWDFDKVWTINEGESYPYLRNLEKPLGVSEGLPINDVRSGIGTVSNPYIICSKEQLMNLKYDNASNYKLSNDIDLEGVTWEPVGSSAVPFTGTFDGNGYMVSNFTVIKPEVEGVGFFGNVRNGKLINITLNNVSVMGNLYIGGLAGLTMDTTICNCEVKGNGTINGVDYVGGLIGYAHDGTVEKCSVKINVSMTGTRQNCGGLIGTCGANVSKSYASGNVTSTGYNNGGLIGSVACINSISISITECYASGNVTGIGSNGGLIGYVVSSGVKVIDCFSQGIVTTTVSNGKAGGLVGIVSTNASIINCYSVGKVTGNSSFTGGLVGYLSGTVNNSFFNSTLTGLTVPVSQAKTTEQLKQKATFIGWDFTKTWKIMDGVEYPKLLNTEFAEYIPAPTGLKMVSSSNDKIEISWQAVNNAKWYDVEVDGVIINNNLSTVFIHENLIPWSNHTYRVRQNCDLGVSQWSPLIKISTLPDMAGSGIESDPYIIKTVEALKKVKNNLSAHYKLANNLNLNSEEWEPIGTYNTPFKGVFDGNGFTISNLTINCYESDNIGFFSSTASGANIKNLKLELSDSGIMGRNYIGGLIGLANPGTLVTNCIIAGKGKVNGVSEVGGVAGAFWGSMGQCSSQVDVVATGSGNAGGLIGRTALTINASDSVTVNITECYSTGNITNINGSAGGLVGYSVNVYSVQSNIVMISNSCAIGRIQSKIAYGLVGLCNTNISQENVFGKLNIYDSYSLCELNAIEAYPISNYVFHGKGHYKTPSSSIYSINRSYYGGKIIATNKFCIGVPYSTSLCSASFSNNYYNAKLAGVITSDGTAKTSTEMKWKATYQNWDFTNTWEIDEGQSYPYLKKLLKPSDDKLNPLDSFGGGKGTKAEPLMIYTEEQLNDARYSPTACFILEKNIILTKEWEPVGSYSNPYKGVFDGNGFTISNITINKQGTDNIGFFSCIEESATIKNLKLELSSIGVFGKNYVGGLVGISKGARIINCIVTGEGDVNGINEVGGIAGASWGNLWQCSSQIDVVATGTGNAGGLVGRTAYTSDIILDSYSIDIFNCYATGNVTNINGSAGGLVGYSLYNCSSKPTFVIIRNSYAIGKINSRIAYGLAGLCNISTNDKGKYFGFNIRDCYSLCELNATTAYPLSYYQLSGNFHIDSSYCIKRSFFGGQMIATDKYGIGVPCSNNIFTTLFSDNYIDSTKNSINISNDSGIKKTTQELMQQATFSGWDFATVWGINESTSYPYLKLLPAPMTLSASKISINSVELVWSSVKDAAEYELEVDGQIRSLGTNTSFAHDNLISGSEHTYKVRSKNSKETSSWSNTLTVVTHLPTPKNLALEISGTDVILTWSAVTGAAGYEIDMDGTIVNAGEAATYTHNVTIPNTQHMYRVRAKTEKAKSIWSNYVEGIVWSPNGPAVCLAQTKWATGEDKTSEVSVKANNITDLYTVHFELQFDPQALEPDTESIANLVWPGNPKSYVKYTVNWLTGKIKLIISMTGTNSGKDGQFDITGIRFHVKKQDSSPINVYLAKLINPSAQYINIPEVQPLVIKLKGEQ